MTSQSTSEGFAHRWCLLATILIAAVGTDTSATIVRYQTNMGNIDVRLFETVKPASTANFLGYVNRGDYTNSLIHRSVPGFIVQGGNWVYNGTAQTEPVDYPTVTSQVPVINEPGISNLRGTVAYAKLPGDPNSATNQWFFNLADNSGNLDAQNGGFTVFARVVGNGMDVVDAIAALPRFGFAGGWSDGPMRNYTAADYQAFTPVDDDNLVIIQSVSLLAIPDGDYNFDGTVDAADYTVWRDTLGSTTLVEADGNGNGVVDAADYIVWQNGFGSSSSISVTVPEPTTLGLLLLGVTCISHRRKADR